MISLASAYRFYLNTRRRRIRTGQTCAISPRISTGQADSLAACPSQGLSTLVISRCFWRCGPFDRSEKRARAADVAAIHNIPMTVPWHGIPRVLGCVLNLPSEARLDAGISWLTIYARVNFFSCLIRIPAQTLPHGVITRFEPTTLKAMHRVFVGHICRFVSRGGAVLVGDRTRSRWTWKRRRRRRSGSRCCFRTAQLTLV